MNYRKKFKTSKSEDKRRAILSEWLNSSFDRISENGTVIEQLRELSEESLIFTKRPVSGLYCLTDKWFEAFVVQVMGETGDPQVKLLYQILGWDYEQALKPTFDDLVTVEKFYINHLEWVNLPLRMKGHAPIGSLWRTHNNGITIWQVNYINEDSSIELESQTSGRIKTMTLSELMKGYKKCGLKRTLRN